MIVELDLNFTRNFLQLGDCCIVGTPHILWQRCRPLRWEHSLPCSSHAQSSHSLQGASLQQDICDIWEGISLTIGKGIFTSAEGYREKRQ